MTAEGTVGAPTCYYWDVVLPINLKLCPWWLFTNLLCAHEVLKCKIPSRLLKNCISL
jgi:hypothetical protein